MKNIAEILKDIGIEIPEDKKAEFEKAIGENYKTVAEFEKKLSKAEGERDDYKKRFEDADAAVKRFEGVDLDGLNKQIEDYKAAAKKSEDDYNAKIAERDFNDALKDAIGGYKFTSNAARSSVMSEVKAAGLKLVDGKIVGLSDVIDKIKEKDADAFVKEDDGGRKPAKFTTPGNTGGNAGTPGTEGLDEEWAARIAKYAKKGK